VAFAALGGEIIKMLQGGKYCGFKFKNRCTKIKMPPLVLMIVFGCIARNLFGNVTIEYYPESWAN
jgi:hypothetical protein